MEFNSADADGATQRRGIANCLAKRVGDANEFLCLAHGLLADRTQANASNVPIKKAHAQVTFEGGNAIRHGGLRGVEPLGGGTEAAESGHPQEGFHKAEVHIIEHPQRETEKALVCWATPPAITAPTEDSLRC